MRKTCVERDSDAVLTDEVSCVVLKPIGLQIETRPHRLHRRPFGSGLGAVAVLASPAAATCVEDVLREAERP